MKAPPLLEMAEMVEMVQQKEVGKEYCSDSGSDGDPALQQNCKTCLFRSCAF